jgi:hypothetical protein
MPITPAGLMQARQIVLRNRKMPLLSFFFELHRLLELQRVHVPTQGVGRNIPVDF